MLIGVPLETAAGEKRVATVPGWSKLIKARLLGRRAKQRRRRGQFRRRGLPGRRCRGRGDAAELWGDIVFKVRAPSAEEVGLMRQGGMLIGFVWPAQNPS